jgi:hypothetical protein
MNCYYHETKEATKHCIHCNKAICSECYHSNYPEYCWSCGLDHDNRLGNAEKDFQFPKMFDNKIIIYIFHKLLSAFGSCLIFTLLMCILFGIFGANEMDSVVFFVGIFTATIVYTYGIIISLIIDFAARYINSIRLWYINGGFYLFFGLLFPFVVVLNNGFNQLTNSIFGGIVSLIFWGLQKSKINKKLITSFGLLSLLPIIILIFLFDLIKAMS